MTNSDPVRSRDATQTERERRQLMIDVRRWLESNADEADAGIEDRREIWDMVCALAKLAEASAPPEAPASAAEALDVSMLLAEVPHFVRDRDGGLLEVSAWPNRDEVLYRGSDLYAALTALPAAGRVPHQEQVDGWMKLYSELVDAIGAAHLSSSRHILRHAKSLIKPTPDPAGDRPPAPQGWQAIETLPDEFKDGRPLLTWTVHGEWSVRYWSQVFGEWRPDGFHPPTLWMPLPDPPSTGLDRSPRPDPQTETEKSK